MMAIKYPMEHGIITDWGDMERIWQHIYGKGQLATFKEEHPVLLTEAPLNPYKNRYDIYELLFFICHSGRKWRKYSSSHSMFPLCTFQCKQFCLFIHQDEQLVLFWTSETVSRILCPFTKDSRSSTRSPEVTLPVVI
jgi:hypothetical protein